MVAPLGSIPSSPDGFFAVNNQFLVSGPKGYAEFKMLENEDMFIRMDLPGVPPEGVKVCVDPTKKAVKVSATAPQVHKHESSRREYGAVSGLVCECCEITGVKSETSDGVLRLIVSKKKALTQKPSCLATTLGGSEREALLAEQKRTGGGSCGSGRHKFPYGSDPQDPALTGPTLQPNPVVLHGSKMAYESKRLQNGNLFVRVDMPGVPEGMFKVSVEKGRVRVSGEAPAISHDSSARMYLGDVAKLDSVDMPANQTKGRIKNGVIRMTIPNR